MQQQVACRLDGPSLCQGCQGACCRGDHQIACAAHFALRYIRAGTCASLAVHQAHIDGDERAQRQTIGFEQVQPARACPCDAGGQFRHARLQRVACLARPLADGAAAGSDEQLIGRHIALIGSAVGDAGRAQACIACRFERPQRQCRIGNVANIAALCAAHGPVLHLNTARSYVNRAAACGIDIAANSLTHRIAGHYADGPACAGHACIQRDAAGLGLHQHIARDFNGTAHCQRHYGTCFGSYHQIPGTGDIALSLIGTAGDLAASCNLIDIDGVECPQYQTIGFKQIQPASASATTRNPDCQSRNACLQRIATLASTLAVGSAGRKDEQLVSCHIGLIGTTVYDAGCAEADIACRAQGSQHQRSVGDVTNVAAHCCANRPIGHIDTARARINSAITDGINVAVNSLVQYIASNHADGPAFAANPRVERDVSRLGLQQDVALGTAHAHGARRPRVDRDITCPAGQNQIASTRGDQIFLRRIGAGRHSRCFASQNHPVHGDHRCLGDGNAGGFTHVQTAAAHIGAQACHLCFDRVVVGADGHCGVQAQHVGVNIHRGVRVVQHRATAGEQADRTPRRLRRQLRRRCAVAANAGIDHAQRDVAIGLDANVAAIALQRGARGHIDHAARFHIQRCARACGAQTGAARQGDVAAGQHREVAGTHIDGGIEVDVARQRTEQHVAAASGQQAAVGCGHAALHCQIALVDVEHDGAVGRSRQILLR